MVERKKIEDNLRKNERLLSETEKIAHIGSWEWSIRSNQFSLSEELYSILDQKFRTSIDYNTFISFFPQNERENISAALQNSIKEFKSFELEHKIFNSKNEEKIIIEKADVIFDENGKPEKVIGIAQDITFRKKTDEHLRKSELYYRSLIENALDIKTILTVEGKIKFISTSVTRTLGYLPEELIGKSIVNFIHSEDISTFANHFNRILEKFDSTTLVGYRFKHKNGGYYYIESILRNLLYNEAVEGIISNSRDVTEKKMAEHTVKTLIAISKRLNSTLDVDILIDILVQESIKLVNAESGNAGLRTAEGLTSKKYFLHSVPQEIEFHWASGIGIPGKVLKDKFPYISNNVAKDPYSKKEFTEKFFIRNSICVPILDSKNEVIGFLELNNKKDEKGFDERDLEKLISLSQTSSTAIQNALTYHKMLMTELQLKNSREQMRRLSAHLQSAREEERTRIAREIHDELGQSLTGLKMDVSWIQKKFQPSDKRNIDLLDKISSMGNLIDETIKTVRKISSELRPGVLDYLGLAAAVEWQAQDFQAHTGIQCNTSSIQKEMELNQNTSTAVFRIFQETLTNIARHSKATHVDIKLLEEDENIILEIKDNGVGITENQVFNSKSLGLLGMKERAHLLGGELTISGSESGTTVTVTIPKQNINEPGDII